MSETPNASQARRIVDDLEDEIVDVEAAQPDDQPGAEEASAEDESSEVPGAPEPTD